MNYFIGGWKICDLDSWFWSRSRNLSWIRKKQWLSYGGGVPTLSCEAFPSSPWFLWTECHHRRKGISSLDLPFSLFDLFPNGVHPPSLSSPILSTYDSYHRSMAPWFASSNRHKSIKKTTHFFLSPTIYPNNFMDLYVFCFGEEIFRLGARYPTTSLSIDRENPTMGRGTVCQRVVGVFVDLLYGTLFWTIRKRI